MKFKKTFFSKTQIGKKLTVLVKKKNTYLYLKTFSCSITENEDP